jgi:hypothetical protein
MVGIYTGPSSLGECQQDLDLPEGRVSMIIQSMIEGW